MATPPVFTSGSVLTAAQMNGIGLWLVKSQTIGTAVSSVTVTGAFTSDYANYRVVIAGGTASATSNIALTLGGISGNVYRQAGFYQSWGTAAATDYAADAGSLIVGQGTTTAWYSIFDITSPNLALQKFLVVHGAGSVTSYVLPSTITSATAATAFTLTPGSGTLTGGTISIYGYR